MANQLTDSQLTVGLGSILSIVPLNTSLPYLVIGSRSVSISCSYSTSNFTLSLPSVGSVSSMGRWSRTHSKKGYLPSSGKYIVGSSTSGWLHDTNNDGYADEGNQTKTVTISTKVMSGGASITSTSSSYSNQICGVAIAAYRLS